MVNKKGNKQAEEKENVINLDDVDYSGDLQAEVEKMEKESEKKKKSDSKKEAKKTKKGFFSKKDSKEVEKLKQQLEEKEEKIKDLEAQVKSLVAENRNQKIRIENEFSRKIKFLQEGFFKEFLTTMDAFDSAMSHLPENIEESEHKALFEGIKLLYNNMERLLEKNGVKKFNSLGEKLNPEFHQAMSVVDVEGKEKDEIVTEYQKGYKYADKVLRPAMVVVASGNFEKKEESKEAETTVEKEESSENK